MELLWQLPVIFGGTIAFTLGIIYVTNRFLIGEDDASTRTDGESTWEAKENWET